MKRLLGMILSLMAYFVLYEILPVNLHYCLFIMYISSIPFISYFFDK